MHDVVSASYDMMCVHVEMEGIIMSMNIEKEGRSLLISSMQHDILPRTCATSQQCCSCDVCQRIVRYYSLNSNSFSHPTYHYPSLSNRTKQEQRNSRTSSRRILNSKKLLVQPSWNAMIQNVPQLSAHRIDKAIGLAKAALREIGRILKHKF